MKLRNKYLLKDLPVVKKSWGGFQVGGATVGEVFVYHKSDLVTSPTGGGLIPNTIKESLRGRPVETVKLLALAGEQCTSLHFHIAKLEYFYVVNGSFEITLIENNEKEILELVAHDCVLIPPGLVHRIKGLWSQNILLEISTLDMPGDSYKIEKGT